MADLSAFPHAKTPSRRFSTLVTGVSARPFRLQIQSVKLWLIPVGGGDVPRFLQRLKDTSRAVNPVAPRVPDQ